MKIFNKLIQEHFITNMSTSNKLFRVELSGDKIWDLYINSFDKSDNPIFRDPSSSTHNCNHCKNFIRRYGNIVSVNSDNKLVTLFDVDIEGEYSKVAKELSKAIKASKIVNVFLETFTMLNSLPYESCSKSNDVFRLGFQSNVKMYNSEEAVKYGVVKTGEARTFNHFYLDLPKEFVDTTGDSVESLIANFREPKNVFKRGLDEISLDTLNLVKDLITQGSLLDGQTHLYKIIDFIKYKEVYDKLSNTEKDNWAWVTSFKLPIAKFKNELIGVLCSELSEGKELNKACEDWNKRVDPANYMKAKAPITQKQINEAKEFVEENGYAESFDRRLAILDDIKTHEIKHLNAGNGKIKEVSIFDNVKATSTRHKRNEFDNVEEVSIEKFMSDILPSCTSVELLLDNKHERNMVTLTTSRVEDSKAIFKWDNNYSWTFNGNLAGKSQLKEMVQAKGGRIDGVFRFSQSWNNLGQNQSLMDLHVFMPGNEHINSKNIHDNYGIGRRVGWNKRNDPQSGGNQDVDYVNQAPLGYVPVENITFPTLSRMPEGKYICKIHNWNFRSTTNSGGKAEIEFDGQIFEYEYPKLENKEWCTIAEVTLKNGQFSIEHKLQPLGSSSKEIYGLESNQFHKVKLISLSPNHWGKNAVGNKHYFFFLDNCKNSLPIRSFHNENLIGDLLEHRKVMEVLGNTQLIETKGNDNQLSGVGFNATVKDDVILKLSGSFKRVIKVKF